MKYGLIGYPLGHSWSPEIHGLLIHAEYEKKELREEELDAFFTAKDFKGINVTIPYKQTVIKYLDELSPEAARIGAVNCIVNENGRLHGYNTDCLGFAAMLKAHDIPLGKAAVLGSGGAARAVKTALADLGADPVIVSRHPSEGMLSYEQMYEQEKQFVLLVNATPVGMFPEIDRSPADLKQFTHLQAVVDVVANPLRTKLQFEAQGRNLLTCGGFEMLVRQAAAADELFTGEPVGEEQIEECMRQLYLDRRSVILIGMPTSGKTTLGRLLAEQTGRNFIDMDEVLSERLGMSIADCFLRYGEEYFRRMESQLAREQSVGGRKVISTGGGVIKNEDNMRWLSAGGQVIWIQRDQQLLYPSADRPLSSDREAVMKLYEERKKLYERYSDAAVENNGTPEEAVNQIMKITGDRRL
jgi:shikimate dehydrogenase